MNYPFASASASGSRATPRASKFSRLKNIRTDFASPRQAAASVPVPSSSHSRATPPQEDGAASTLQLLDRQWEEVAFRDDCDEKVRRHRYAQTVLRMMEQANQYHSIGLFVEAMLRELQTSEDADVATRAAVGTWALNLLAAQSASGALEAISAAVLPAVYCQYNPSLLDRPSAAVRAQVRDPKVINGNPYFTHSMYVEQVTVDRGSVEDLSVRLRNAIECNDLKRNYVIRRVAAASAETVTMAFRAWRAHARRARVLATTNKNRSIRQEAAARQLRMQSIFYRWKVALEVSRNAFLTERLHDAAMQLENAKNQFQLQCYRADRLIQSDKETREELVRMRDLNEDLQRRVESLKDELTRREIEFNEKLASSVTAALNLVQSYSHVVATLAHARMRPQRYQIEGTGESATAEAERDEEEASDELGGSGTGTTTSAETPTSTETAAAAVPVVVAAAGAMLAGGLPVEVDSEEAMALDVLRRWCNSVLREVQGARFRPIHTFGMDFVTGEAYLVLLNHVFPDTTSLVPNQESNVEYRLRRIKDMSEKSRLVHVLSPEDFVEQREDRITQSLCELYTRYLDRQWHANAVATSVAFTDELRQDSAATPVTVTDEVSFQAFVAECSDRLVAVKKEMLQQSYHEEELVVNRERIKAEEAYLCEEARKGLPLLHVGDVSSRLFWNIAPKSINDLRQPELIATDVQMWDQLMGGPFPRMLKDCASVTSRLFCFYAGGNVKVMSEFAFWRFVETQNLCSSGLQKETVATVFDRVASPQLATAIKVAAFGRTDMNTQTLRRVARQELDIRSISPTQFVEILVRLGVEVHGRTAGLVEGVGRFLREMVLPRCHLLAPVQAAFYESGSRYVVNFFCDDLARVFFFYLKRQESSKVARDRFMATQDGGRFAGLLSVNTFTLMLNDCVFLSDGSLAIDVIGMPDRRTSSLSSSGTGAAAGAGPKSRAFISSTQVQEAILGLSKPYPTLRTGEMTFTVFLESLALVSCYWCPNPLVPPSRKLAAFLSDYIGQLNVRHANSTLILGTPPFITLEGGPKVDFSLKANMYM